MVIGQGKIPSISFILTMCMYCMRKYKKSTARMFENSVLPREFKKSIVLQV